MKEPEDCKFLGIGKNISAAKDYAQRVGVEANIAFLKTAGLPLKLLSDYPKVNFSEADVLGGQRLMSYTAWHYSVTPYVKWEKGRLYIGVVVKGSFCYNGVFTPETHTQTVGYWDSGGKWHRVYDANISAPGTGW